MCSKAPATFAGPISCKKPCGVQTDEAKSLSAPAALAMDRASSVDGASGLLYLPDCFPCLPLLNQQSIPYVSAPNQMAFLACKQHAEQHFSEKCCMLSSCSMKRPWKPTTRLSKPHLGSSTGRAAMTRLHPALLESSFFMTFKSLGQQSAGLGAGVLQGIWRGRRSGAESRAQVRPKWHNASECSRTAFPIFS